jgi:hypothetical protein
MASPPLPDVPPDQYRTFYELPTFAAQWGSLKLDESDRLALQAELMTDPGAGAVVRGTGGLRKLRFSPPSQMKGKRGAVRVYYAHLPDWGVVVLAVAFGKSERADIPARQRKVLAAAVESLEAALRKRRAARARGEAGKRKGFGTAWPPS